MTLAINNTIFEKYDHSWDRMMSMYFFKIKAASLKGQEEKR